MPSGVFESYVALAWRNGSEKSPPIATPMEHTDPCSIIEGELNMWPEKRVK